MKNKFIALIVCILSLIVFVDAGNAQTTTVRPRAVKMDENTNSQKLEFDLTDALSQYKLSGHAPGDYFGYSTAPAGDVNGDGFPDVIVGAYSNDGNGVNSGRAYIYFGGPVYDNQADVILTGEASQDYFGTAVAAAGDVNGDGYSDVIVGAPYNDAAGTNAGRAYVYYGGNFMNNTPDIILTGASANDNFGSSLSSAGFMNGDGYADFMVGAPYNDAAGSDAGRVYIYFGNFAPDNVADVILSGIAANDAFGVSVSTAGDINGDGFGDVVVGAPYNDFNYTEGGGAYVYYGGSSVNNVIDITLTGPNFFGAAFERFGFSVSTAGDLTGDGYSDLIIGAPFNSYFAAEGGGVYLYAGGPFFTGSPFLLVANVVPNSYSGISVASAGDINGDGYSDIIYGSPYSSTQISNGGRSSVIYGGTDIYYRDFYVDLYVAGFAANDYLGYSVAGAGDIDGDGYGDFIASAYGNDGNGTDAGAAYIYRNTMRGNHIPNRILSGQAFGDNYGNSVSSAGDFNGDGYKDIIVGAPYNDANGGNAGRAYIYYSGNITDNIVDVTLTGFGGSEFFFGYSVSSAGDVNGDGFSDVIVGAYSGVNGKAYIYFGGSFPDNVADITLTGEAFNDQFGYSVSGAGDMNGDGFSDVVVGAPANDFGGTDAGKIYVYYGGASMNNTPDAQYYWPPANGKFGKSVSCAGDVNDDGYSDIIVGAPENNDNGTEAGKAFLFLGGQSPFNGPAMYFTGEMVGDRLGTSVSTAGDVNKDGYDDVIVGAFGNDALGNETGRAYLYFGGLSLNNTADVIYTGSEQLSYFGNSVSTAGDVNKDGYDDVIVGVPYYLSYTGSASIFFGGVSPDNSADVILTGTPNSYTGWSVAGLGDINADGYSDVIAGASFDDLAGTDFGGAHIHLSSAPSVSPILNYINDVPDDQGGYVHIKWARSGYDISSIGTITEYLIERSFPPGTSGLSWEVVGRQTATNNPFYSFTAPTPSDSSIFYFRVTARTSNAGEVWRSVVLTGISTDNLSPQAPMALMAEGQTSSIDLTWDANTEIDLKDYLIYRNDALISSSITNTFSDATAELDSVYIYKIAARDIHNNISNFSNLDTASRAAITFYNVKIIPEGIYNASTDQLRMRDTVKAYLWDITGSTLVDSAIGIIDSVTFLTDFEFKYAVSGTYYLAIVHRNCIETWSKVGGEAVLRGQSHGYDFTTSNTMAYGDNLKLKGTRYCLYSGDVNSSGVVNSTDRTLIRNNVGSVGYVRFDLDGNGVVNSSDRTIVRNNTGISRQRP